MKVDISRFLSTMQSVTLAQLDEVSLQDRIDCKYILTHEQLNLLLPIIQQNYKVLEINKHRVHTYINNYFDTHNVQFYYDHHNGYSNRIKVRCRKYLETNICFFEVKQKQNVERTSKTRERIPDLISEINELQQRTVQNLSRKPISDLSWILNNKFNRITFVDNFNSERVTLDYDIQFSDSENTKSITEFYVLEIKQSKSNCRSIVTETLKKNNIREQSFSKYVFGVIALKSGIRRNNFLPILKKNNLFL
jgi:VTC domain